MKIELQNIHKTYPGRAAAVLDDLTLTLESGRTTVLIGPSGCGKSTLIRLINGLVWPDRGGVQVDGVSVTPRNVNGLRRAMGYVVQDGGLFPHLTGYGNLALLPRAIGWTRQQIDTRIAELRELVHLRAETLSLRPRQLSGGQQQRLGLMRALMTDPAVLLFDEPLAALDPLIRRDLQNDLRAIFQRLRKTVLLVTHDLGEAGFFADHIVLMGRGRIVQQGSLADLVHRPADEFVTRFVNAQRSPLENL